MDVAIGRTRLEHREAVARELEHEVTAWSGTAAVLVDRGPGTKDGRDAIEESTNDATKLASTTRTWLLGTHSGFAPLGRSRPAQALGGCGGGLRLTCSAKGAVGCRMVSGTSYAITRAPLTRHAHCT